MGMFGEYLLESGEGSGRKSFDLGELCNNGSVDVFPPEVSTCCKKMLTLVKCTVW